MNDVSPLGFIFLVGALMSVFPLEIFKGLLVNPVDLLAPERTLFYDLPFVGDNPCFGPLSLFCRTYFTACSFVKQSHIPSQAHIMKSCSAGLNGTFLISGKDVT
jgi:hypothetical protein